MCLLGVFDELSVRCFALRSQRNYDDALRLDLLVANLSEKGSIPILDFVLNLTRGLKI